MYKKLINIWENVQTHKKCQLKQQIVCCTYNTGFNFFLKSIILTDVDPHFFLWDNTHCVSWVFASEDRGTVTPFPISL